MATVESATCWNGRCHPGTTGSSSRSSGRTIAEANDGRFFRRLSIDLRIDDVSRSYHVPLLLAPYSMTTYRGS